MALSGFIKQLLETDAVFGSEAKKLTGINDRTNNSLVTVKMQGLLDTRVDITPTSPTNIRFTFKNVPSSEISFSDDFVPNALIRVRLSEVTSSDKSKIAETQKYNNRLYLIKSVDNSTPGSFIVVISMDPEDDPFFSELVSVTDVQMDEAVFDPRIASIIDNGVISKQSENGSTMFNLDNTSSGDVADGPSGIARKYASHYHGEKQVNIVSNNRDDRGNPLIRYTIDTDRIDGEKVEFFFLEDVVRTYVRIRQLDPNMRDGTAPDIKMIYDDGVQAPTVVAQFGDLGRTGLGTITLNSYPTFPVPPGGGNLKFGTVVSFYGEGFYFGNIHDVDPANAHVWEEPPEGQRTTGYAIRTLRDVMQNVMDGIFPGRYLFFAFDPIDQAVQTLTILGARGTNSNIDFFVTRGTGAPVNQIEKTNVTGGTDPTPQSGITFINQEQLLTVLQLPNTYNVTASQLSDRILLRTDQSPDKAVLFGEPIPAAPSPVWRDQAGRPIAHGSLTEASIQQRTTIKPAEIVFDRKGNVVYGQDIPDDC